MTTTAAEETRLDGQATQAADVTESQPDSAELAELSRWLEPEETQDETVQNPEPEETESEATPTEGEDDPDLETAVAARAERLAEEKAAQVRAEIEANQQKERDAQAAETRWRGIEESFRTRAPRIRAHLEAVQRGEQELNINGVLEEFNAHNGQMQSVRDSEWYNAIFQATVAQLPDADKQRLASLRQRNELPLDKLLTERDRAIIAKAKEGMHAESRIKEEHALGALSYRSRLEKMLKSDPTGDSVLALLRSRAQPAASRNSNTPARTRASSDILTDPNASQADIDRLLAEAGV